MWTGAVSLFTSITANTATVKSATNGDKEPAVIPIDELVIAYDFDFEPTRSFRYKNCDPFRSFRQQQRESIISREINNSQFTIVSRIERNEEEFRENSKLKEDLTCVR